MKTNIFSSRKAQNYLCIGFLSLFMASCGSYQNSSYYESDGIYGATANRNNIERRNTNSDNYYRDYFNSLQTDGQTSEFITDIDQYSDFDSVDGDSYSSYAGWGNNQTGTIINYYPNYWGMNAGFGWNNWGWNNWGMNYGFGWNNWGWNNWGMNYGLGWNNWGMNYGYGWNNWGWNNSYYYNRPYRNNYSSYTPGRRASVPNNNSREYSSSRNYAPSRSYSTDRNNATTRSSSRFGTSRTPNFTNPRTYNSQNNNSQTTTNRRGATPAAQNNTNSRQQQQYNNTRQQNSNYSRNENYSAPSRSYSSPSSYGGGNSGGGGGGSRSYGGGGGSRR